MRGVVARKRPARARLEKGKRRLVREGVGVLLQDAHALGERGKLGFVEVIKVGVKSAARADAFHRLHERDDI